MEKIMKEFIEVPANKKSFLQRRLLYGVGLNNASYYVTHISGRCPYYRAWESMLMRCYSLAFQKSNPSYIGCYVEESWLIFSTFKAWMIEQDWEGKQLDKDILSRGNKVYSKDTCIFLSSQVNNLLTNNKARRGVYALGVNWDANLKHFKASCSIEGKLKHLGLFKTEVEASECYKTFKKGVIIAAANKQTNLRLKEALLTIAITEY
jgi:hypothetical protein